MCCAVGLLLAAEVLAGGGDAATFAEAKQLAEASGKQILMEFSVDDCEYCAEAAADADTNTAFQQALSSVVYLPLNLMNDEGATLSEQYRVGSTFPVFILTNANGDVLSRWTGYTGAQPFQFALRNALKNSRPIADRIARFGANPTYGEALSLAKYCADTRDFLQAAEFYRRAQQLSPDGRANHAYDILNNLANASWNNSLDFEDVVPAADTVLSRSGRNVTHLVNTAKIMSRLARRAGKTDRIGKYLQAGIDITAGSTNKQHRADHHTFLIDRQLHIAGDTAGALAAYKASLGPDWHTQLDNLYLVAKWSLERKINLEEAERFATQVADRALDGKFKAGVLQTLSGICEARGRITDAVTYMEQATRQLPSADFYRTELERLRNLVEK